ncbi:hypothetical protein SADUNF_Sadunf06G0035500 [Salix dunnii]|uniref:HTH three-helical bundle domain-containing protein n=1 Tax=Salix dunnii TaxID=1413687 RepID=A0A835K0Y6_9ROSI|nr:hypothetical protein SADUNF_Sadunf06G0035500 [Salix dunnii]
MHPFPSPDECTVASALLLLSNTTPLSPPSKQLLDQSKLALRFKFAWILTNDVVFFLGSLGVDGKKYVNERSCEEESLSSVTSGSKSCVSYLTSDVSSFNEIRAHKLRIVAIVSRCHEMKPKVARKKRSKVNWSSGHQRTVVVAPPEKAVEASTESGSCLSSTSSSASSARNHHMKRKGLVMKPARDDDEEPKRIRSSSRYLCSLAEAILKLLSSGVFSEMRIRQVLGDSPSTSKALRMLLRQDEVKRSGRGGRQDPYIYKVLHYSHKTFYCLRHFNEIA